MNETTLATARADQSRIPLAAKLAFTLFMAVLVPFYLQAYGPTNFLYFCDVSLFFTLAALWTESPLLASIPAVGILVPQTLWVLDFAAGVFGFHPIGMTDYMFRDSIPLFARGLSLFHGWLPFVLVWLVARLGYDRRAWLYQSVLALVVLPVTFWLTDHAENVNWVHGLSRPQTALPSWAYLALLIIAFSLVLYLPPHLVFGYLPLSVMSS